MSQKCIIFPHLHSFRHENTKDKREANDGGVDPRRAHAGVHPEPEQPAKYVQLFFLVCSSLNFELRLQNFRKELQ